MGTQGSGLLVNGRKIHIPGLNVSNVDDNPALKLAMDDGKPRLTRWIRACVIHTTKGLWPKPGGQVIQPGFGPDADDAAKVARYWSNSDKHAGAQIVVDRDGDVGCLADIFKFAAFHAGKVNDVSVGHEVFQESDGDLYEGAISKLVLQVDVETWLFQIPRQVQVLPYRGKPAARLVRGGQDCCGVYAHRDVSANRGRGDAGDAIIRAFLDAGYEPVDFYSGTDLGLWRARQHALVGVGFDNLHEDGVCGPATTRAVQLHFGATKPRGLWVRRPIDTCLEQLLGNEWRP